MCRRVVSESSPPRRENAHTCFGDVSFFSDFVFVTFCLYNTIRITTKVFISSCPKPYLQQEWPLMANSSQIGVSKTGVRGATQAAWASCPLDPDTILVVFRRKSKNTRNRILGDTVHKQLTNLYTYKKKKKMNSE